MRRPASAWQAWPRIASQLHAARRRGRAAIFSDFDGTLALIVRHPKQARLPASTRRALRQLSSRPGVMLGVVSGRALADLRRRVRLQGLWYIGSHGEEWKGPTGRVHHRASAGLRQRIQKLCRVVRERMARCPGVYVECKPASVAVHYRNVRAAVAARARRAVKRILRELPSGFRLLEGKKVREILPPGNTSKGQAVRHVLAQLTAKAGRRPRLLYLGDDRTDETVFARLRRGDIGIHVGRSRRTRAGYRLDSPAEAGRFLQRLAEELE